MSGNCDTGEYLQNWTRLLQQTYDTNQSSGDNHESHETNQLVEFYISKVGLPMVCIFGILGNILNLLVLTQKQLQSSMDRLEKSAHLGLVALAVSDMMFCTLALPLAFLPKPSAYLGLTSLLTLSYSVYHQPLLNIFLFSSTWLTVVMATGRYLAICHPLHVRGFINLKGTRAAICLVFLFSVLINLPQFWQHYISSEPCPIAPQCTCYWRGNGQLFTNKTFVLAYMFTWSILGVFVPIIILAVCNICLINALQRSNRMRRRYRANQQTATDSGHRITPTLITIVLLFIILVCPSEIFKFVKRVALHQGSHPKQFFHLQTITHITNFMVAINFAINFVLYCAINVHFRKIIKKFILCQGFSKPERREFTKTSQHSTITYNLSDMETDL